MEIKTFKPDNSEIKEYVIRIDNDKLLNEVRVALCKMPGVLLSSLRDDYLEVISEIDLDKYNLVGCPYFNILHIRSIIAMESIPATFASQFELAEQNLTAA